MYHHLMKPHDSYDSDLAVVAFNSMLGVLLLSKKRHELGMIFLTEILVKVRISCMLPLIALITKASATLPLLT